MVDFMAALVGSVALVATVTLAILGFRFTQDTTSMNKRLIELATIVKAEQDRVFGVRSSAATIARLLSESYAVLDVMRRALLDLTAEDRLPRPGRGEILERALKGPLERLSRIQEYLKLLNPRPRADFHESVADFVSKFPDLTAVDELNDLAALLPRVEAEVARQAADRLRHQLQGYDSSQWTG